MPAMLGMRYFLPFVFFLFFSTHFSFAQELKVYKSSYPEPSNLWTTWEPISKPWFECKFSQPFEKMRIRVSNHVYGGSYDREIEMQGKPEPVVWEEDLPTGRYECYVCFNYYDPGMHAYRWSEVYRGPDFYVDLSAPNAMSVSTNGFPAYTFPVASWTTRTDLTFTWTNPGDAGSGVHHYELSVNGGAWQSISSGYSPSLNTGSYSFSFRAVDNIGLIGPARTFYTNIDLHSPNLSPVDLYGSAYPSSSPPWRNSGSVRLRFNSSDQGSGIQSRQLSLNGGAWGSTLEERTIAVTTGEYTFDMKVIDKVGYESSVKRLYARIDRDLPEITITSPGTDTIVNTGTLLLEWSGWDEHSGIDLYAYKLNSEGTVNTGSNTSATLESLPEGTNQLLVLVRDNAMNMNRDTVMITVDLTPPQIASNHENDTLTGNENCEAVLPDYTPDLISTDNFTAVPDVTQIPEAGTIMSGNTNNVILEVKDEAGNTSQVNFNVTVIDEIDPVINTCLPDQEVMLDENCSFTLPDYTADPGLSVSECSPFTVTQEPVAGTAIDDTTQVTLTVTDEYGNTAECSFHVNTVDQIKPLISCPEDRDITLDFGESFYEVQGNELDPLSYSDNCSEAMLSNNLNQSSTLNGELLEEGTMTITWTITDQYANTASCSFELSISPATDLPVHMAGNLKLYPNPTTGIIYMESPGQVPESVSISNLSGKIIFSSSDLDERNTFDLSPLLPGMYLIRIQTEDSLFTEIIIKR